MQNELILKLEIMLNQYGMTQTPIEIFEASV